jgi:two-component system, NarL family, response regulator NreC
MADDLIRIIIGDEHPVVRCGIRAILGAERDLLVVGEAGNGAESVELAGRVAPDIAIMGVTMLPMNGIEATRCMASKGLRTRVVIYTSCADADSRSSAMFAGAFAYVLKSGKISDLADAVRSAAHGNRDLRTRATSVGAHHRRSRTVDEAATERFELLSARERSILVFVVWGFTSPEIGARLSISPKTVDTFKHRIKEKVGLVTRPELVRLALQLGLLGPEPGTWVEAKEA